MLTLTDPRNGVEFDLDRLPRCPGEAEGGWRLSPRGLAAAGGCCHVHRLAGLTYCDCQGWTEADQCRHVKLLVADGLIEAPVPASCPFDMGDLVDIDCSEAWHPDEVIELADTL